MRVTVGGSGLCCVLVLGISSANYLPCVLVLHERSESRFVSG